MRPSAAIISSNMAHPLDKLNDRSDSALVTTARQGRPPRYSDDELLAVVTAEFNERGYDATSMEDLARVVEGVQSFPMPVQSTSERTA